MSDDTPEDHEPVGGPPPRWRGLFVSLPRALIATLILVGVAINFANVISRYLFNFALFWAEEAMVFIIVWCVFIGAIAVTFNGAHLRMDLLSARLVSPWREIVNSFTMLTFLACGCFAAFQSWKVVSLIGGIGQVSNAGGIPMVIPHLALLVGFVFMVIVVAMRWRAYVTGRF
jgi:TRAP-type C4-dicarboxylate transport system permease small subunit